MMTRVEFIIIMFFISLHELSKPHTAKSRAMAMVFFVFFVAYKNTTTTIYLFFSTVASRKWCLVAIRVGVGVLFVF
jgi:hypothetical protein